MHALDIAKRIIFEDNALITNVSTKRFELQPQSSNDDELKVRDPLYDGEEIPGIIGTNLRRAFDMKQIIARLVDASEMNEFKALYGTTIITGTV